MSREMVDEQMIKNTTDCIKTTELNLEPANKLQKLLKDVDISYALYTDFKVMGDLLRKEHLEHLGKVYDNDIWNQMQCAFLDRIILYSDYGKLHFKSILEDLKRSCI
jgi:hypothetical protein